MHLVPRAYLFLVKFQLFANERLEIVVVRHGVQVSVENVGNESNFLLGEGELLLLHFLCEDSGDSRSAFEVVVRGLFFFFFDLIAAVELLGNRGWNRVLLLSSDLCGLIVVFVLLERRHAYLFDLRIIFDVLWWVLRLNRFELNRENRLAIDLKPFHFDLVVLKQLGIVSDLKIIKLFIVLFA